MINKKFFEIIVKGLADNEQVLSYYKVLEIFITENEPDKHPDLSVAIEHKTFIEDCYGEILPKKEQPTERPSTINLEPSEELIKEIDLAIDLDYSPTNAIPVLHLLAHKYNWRLNELTKYYYGRKDRKENEDFKKEVEMEVNEVTSISKFDLNLSHFFLDSIAEPLTGYSNNLQIKHAITLTALLTGVSVCNRVGTRLLVDESKGWKEPPGIYSLMVSPSGQGKSPILYALIQKPFWEIQSEWKHAFDTATREYYQHLEEIKLLQKEEKAMAMKDLADLEPPKQPRILFASDPTVIGLNGQFEAYPYQGLLGLYDEASKLFAFDRTSSGKSDKSDILSYYNGLGVVELRRDGIRANVGECIFSIFGLIQPDVLLELMSDCVDPDGKWARFTFCIQPLQRKLRSRETLRIDINDLIAGLYRRVLALPQTLYFLDKEAQNLFDYYLYDEIELKRVQATSPGLMSMYGKAGGQVARYALNLHVLNGVSKDTEVSQQINAETMFKAIRLNRFYISQVKLLHSKAQVMQDEALGAKLAMILEIAKNRGSVTTRDLKRSSRAFRKEDPSQIREWFKKLEEMQKGVCKGNGSRLQFIAL